MKLEEVKTKKEFVDYMKQYGTHVEICIFDYLGIRRTSDYNTYSISFYKRKHRANWYNTSKIREKESTSKECFDMIRNELRRHKIKKLKNKIA